MDCILVAAWSNLILWTLCGQQKSIQDGYMLTGDFAKYLCFGELMEDLGLNKRYNSEKFPASHAGNRGSIPRGVTFFNDLANPTFGLHTICTPPPIEF